MSIARRQLIRRGSSPSALPQCRWLSIIAARRLLAAVTAWISPVKWRLMSSIGTTCARPPPVAPPFTRNTGRGRFAQADQRPPAEGGQRIAQADGSGGLALSGRGGGDAGDEDERALPPRPRRQRHLGLEAAVRVPPHRMGCRRGRPPPRSAEGAPRGRSRGLTASAGHRLRSVEPPCGPPPVPGRGTAVKPERR